MGTTEFRADALVVGGSASGNSNLAIAVVKAVRTAGGRDLLIAIVCQATGGLRHSRVATVTADTILESISADTQADIQEMLVDAFRTANRRVYESINLDEASVLNSFSAVALTAIDLDQGSDSFRHLYCAIAGSCAIYLVRNEQVQRLSQIWTSSYIGESKDIEVHVAYEWVGLQNGDTVFASLHELDTLSGITNSQYIRTKELLHHALDEDPSWTNKRLSEYAQVRGWMDGYAVAIVLAPSDERRNASDLLKKELEQSEELDRLQLEREQVERHRLQLEREQQEFRRAKQLQRRLSFLYITLQFTCALVVALTVLLNDASMDYRVSLQTQTAFAGAAAQQIAYRAQTEIAAQVILETLSVAATRFAVLATSTPTPSPTQTSPPTETSSSEAIGIRVANASYMIKTLIGTELGNGTLNIYYNDSVAGSSTMRVELEMYFNNYYVTPTPFGPRTAIPAPITPTFVTRNGTLTPETSPTPHVPRYVGDPEIIEIFELMGASLVCLPTSFEGCNAAPNEVLSPDDVRRIPLNGMKWSWIVSPAEGAEGSHQLRIDLWRPSERTDGAQRAEVIWSHEFEVEVPPTSGGNTNIPTEIWVAVIGAASAIVVAIITLRNRREHAADKSTNAKPDSTLPRLKVFISYRRSGGMGFAQLVHDRLTIRGVDAFIDTKDIHEGRFAGIITQNIAACDYFVVVLAPTTLESEWVVREINLALECDRKIVPMLIDGFKLEESALPASIRSLSKINAIPVPAEYVDPALDRLYEFLGLAPTERV
ncbi:MAG: TIR domain-containing protein [Chloroflexi bacterium]|uniref:TIR domain-containing protein n=1 Tax=Candidatus Flexifilum breve TaxID=3140694 RepID=UPI00313707A1|nr:TIR domain-containing protein [Chloroflexota bacterium]